MEGFTKDFTKEQSGLDSNPQRGSLVPEFLNHWEMEAGKPLACSGTALRCLSGDTKSRAGFVIQAKHRLKGMLLSAENLIFSFFPT